MECHSGPILSAIRVSGPGMGKLKKTMGLAAGARVFVTMLTLFPFCCGAEGVTNLQPLAVWETSSRVTAGAGYRENVLRSSIAQENSAFFNTSADVSLMRFTESGAYVTYFFLFDDSQYFDAPSVDYERFVSATVQAATPVGVNDELGAQVNSLYQHQVVDLSETETDMSRTLVDGYMCSLLPHWKHTLSDGWAVQAEAEALRQLYSGDDISDYWAPAAGVRLIRSYGHRSELSVYGQSKYLAYDARERSDHGGEAIPGTSLVYQQNEMGGQWRHNFDKAQQWRTRSKLNYKLSHDNGSGYYDYNRLQFSQQLRWKKPLWEVKSNACFNWYSYPEQEIDDERYERSSIMLDVRIERRLGKRWLLYSFAEREWNMSNDALDQYNSWTAGAGAGFEF